MGSELKFSRIVGIFSARRGKTGGVPEGRLRIFSRGNGRISRFRHDLLAALRSLLVVNSAKGRQKDRNLRRDPRVALSIQDPDNPYRYLEVRGRVEQITEQGADASIDALAKHYMGVETYPLRKAGEQRVIDRIRPMHVVTVG